MGTRFTQPLTRRSYPIKPALEYLGAADVPNVRGTTYRRMLCPFHPDTRPSARVNEYGFTCFSCGVSGDAIKLIRREEPDYKAAIAILEELVGPENRGSTPEREWGKSLLG